MLIEGTKILALPREEVWKALNDPAFLQSSIPGCRRVTEPQPDNLAMELTSSVGPIKVNFTVEVKKLEVNAPESYVLEGSGSGGVAGSATGRVHVRLVEVEGGTQLEYSATTEITGRIAQLGSRLIDSTARKFSEEFFSNVVKAMSRGRGTSQQIPDALAAAPGSANATGSNHPSPAIPAQPSAAAPPASYPTTGHPAMEAMAWRLALDGFAWRLAIGCAVGSCIGTVAAMLLMRSGA
jgi:hypothetical protein